MTVGADAAYWASPNEVECTFDAADDVESGIRSYAVALVKASGVCGGVPVHRPASAATLPSSPRQITGLVTVDCGAPQADGHLGKFGACHSNATHLGVAAQEVVDIGLATPLLMQSKSSVGLGVPPG